MLARIDTAKACLLFNVREAVEGADDPGEHFRSDAQMERLGTEQGAQHERGAGADRGVCTGVRRIGAVLPAFGSQVGFAAVSGLPSVAAARIAVTGRHRLYAYLVS